MNSLELGFYKSRIRDELAGLEWDADPLGTIDRVIFMLNCLKRFSVATNVEHFARLYPELSFTESLNYVVVRHKNYKQVRAEAIDYRNRLMADGFGNFRVLYADNGFVESFSDSPESTALDELKVSYGDNFNLYRIDANDSYPLSVSAHHWLDEANATSLADAIKERYPWMLVVVYFGELNTSKVVRR